MPKGFEDEAQARRVAQRVGERLRAVREALGWTQAEAAERLGLSTEGYGRLERGDAAPSFPSFVRICDVLAVTPNDLLGESTSRSAGDLGEVARGRRLARDILRLKTETAAAVEQLVRTLADR